MRIRVGIALIGATVMAATAFAAFSDGVAAVKIGSGDTAKYALIDPTGKVIWQDQ